MGQTILLVRLHDRKGLTLSLVQSMSMLGWLSLAAFISARPFDTIFPAKSGVGTPGLLVRIVACVILIVLQKAVRDPKISR